MSQSRLVGYVARKLVSKNEWGFETSSGAKPVRTVIRKVLKTGPDCTRRNWATEQGSETLGEGRNYLPYLPGAKVRCQFAAVKSRRRAPTAGEDPKQKSVAVDRGR